ncbi:hypothetical protein ABMA28_000365 [Loxostege sticticalis]|uniref:MULE transposase domain-containing protein n=1 Tax=Loxostege sticticalis TaxID=481309 RepID=A0ABD0TSJ8_LOXSC
MEHNKCEFVKSRKKNDLLFLNGFLYMLNKKCDNVFYWSCVRKRSSSCGAAVTKSEFCGGKCRKAIIKKKSSDSFDTFDRPGQIIQKVLQNVPRTSASFMPSKEAMRLVIHRERVSNEPKLPKTLNEFIIPDEFNKFEGEQFLIGHFIDDNDTILVFSTKTNLRLLDKSKFWIMDGTFQCCPDLFYQLYSIHGQVGQNDDTKQVLPLVVGLLSSKSERAYGIFIQIVLRFTYNQLNINLNPDFIITDFELAAIRASESAFPNAKHKCCFFHLSQNIWKHIQMEGLSKKYISNSEFAHQMRHLAALVYLDPMEIPSAFEMIREQIIPQETSKVTDWFSEYYIDGLYKRETNQKMMPALKLKLKRKPHGGEK